MINELTVLQRSTLAAVLKAFLPTSEILSPSDLKARVETVQSIIADTTEEEQTEFHKLLDLLQKRIVTWIWAGKGKGFTDLPRENQVKLLQKWAGSRLGVLRKAFMVLKKLCLFAHYGQATETNAHWTAIGYPGPRLTPIENEPARIPIQVATEGQTLTCDVLVIGSGAGGGIAAGILAEAGKHVILVEKGAYLEGQDFTDRETDMVRATFDRSGAFMSNDGGVSILAGSCLGGGTTINWNGSFATPGYILEEWHRGHGLDFAMGKEYGLHMQQVMQSIGVNGEHSGHSAQNQMLFDGCAKLGRNPQVIERNVQGCKAHGLEACGYCNFGCRQDNKNSTLKTWIRRAVAKGAQVMVHASAEQILHAQGQVMGATLVQQGPGGQRIRFQIHAKQVVLAAGAIHSPAILLRSGIQHAAIGRHLYFHPTVAVAGFYDQVMDPWHGAIMTAVDKHALHLDGNYGYWIETPPVHAGMASLALPWQRPAQHHDDMLRIRNMASFIVLTRDQFGGQVKVNKQGRAKVDYTLHPYDRAHMLKGIRAAFELHRAAGASEVVFPHGEYLRYKIRTSKISADAYLGSMHKWGWKPNQFSLFTAHQMGTCAMGGDSKQHPFTPSGESRQVRGLFIADGSALPSSVGINPMVSIMAMAAWVAKGMT